MPIYVLEFDPAKLSGVMRQFQRQVLVSEGERAEDEAERKNKPEESKEPRKPEREQKGMQELDSSTSEVEMQPIRERSEPPASRPEAIGSM